MMRERANAQQIAVGVGTRTAVSPGARLALPLAVSHSGRRSALLPRAPRRPQHDTLGAWQAARRRRMRVTPVPAPRDEDRGGGAGADGGGRPDHAAGVLIRPGRGRWPGSARRTW
eukprot:3903175-Prymnesium_polylepis.2